MRLAVARETRPGETRVALTPDLVGRVRELGYDVAVQSGAGTSALWADEDYVRVGAKVFPDAVEHADVVLSVGPLAPAVRIAPGASLVSLTPPWAVPVGATAYVLERVPRTSRAQAMDALTSQALVVGYRGAVVTAGLLRRFLPLTMTAAGKVPAARVVVLGAGVVGLQVIATLLRLGAIVQAYDVRASSAEEIRSLGAEALDLRLPPLEGAAGYAREMSAERAMQQQARLAPYVAAADALVTTAAVPGRRAPLLVTASMVAAMSPGSVVVDLAAESGGNVEGVVAGSTVRVGRTTVWGGQDVVCQLPQPASALLAGNMVAFLTLVSRGGRFAPDPRDEIVTACRVR